MPPILRGQPGPVAPAGMGDLLGADRVITPSDDARPGEDVAESVEACIPSRDRSRVEAASTIWYKRINFMVSRPCRAVRSAISRFNLGDGG